MKPPAPVPRVRDYLRIVARYWMVIVCATALSVGAGWLARQTSDPEYRATTRVFIEAPSGAEVLDAYYGNLSAMAHAYTIQQLARNPQVAKRTIDQLGLNQTPEDLIERITPTIHGVMLEISVTGDTPELAKDTANSVAFNTLTLDREMADLVRLGTETVPIDAASDASDSRAPLSTYLMLGGVLGLVLSTLLVIVLGRARDSVLTGEQVAHIVGETVAGRNT